MYLYVFEDGEIGQSNDPPTVADCEAIDDGLLQVVRFANGKVFFIDGAGGASPIDMAKLAGKKYERYHTM